MALSTPYPYNAITTPPIQIVPGATSVPYIVVNKYGSTTTLLHSITKTTIKAVSFVYNPNPGKAYPWRTLTHLVLSMHDGDDITFELQTVENQGTWNTGTQAGCIAAVTAINASL